MTAAAPGARCWVVIPAAGRGERMGAARPKQYLPLAGATVLEHALRPFLAYPPVAGISVALDARDRHWQSLSCSRHAAVRRAQGGAERMHSVLNALDTLTEAAAQDWVLVHDAARPCLARSDLDRLFRTLREDRVGGLLALPMNETVKRAAADSGRVSATVDRSDLWYAQTPQMFRFGELRRALRQALENGLTATDEAAAMEALGHRPRLVEGSSFNIKITRQQDMVLAEAILTEALADETLPAVQQGAASS